MKAYTVMRQVAAASSRVQLRHVCSRPVIAPAAVFRPFQRIQIRCAQGKAHFETEKAYEKPASELNHDITEEEKIQFDKDVSRDKSKIIKSPWHREGVDTPPVTEHVRSAGAMTKGRILTTPTRLFKLVLPLTVNDHNSDRKDAAPLALLVHPSQPLSYLERLIQAELPLLRLKDKEKVPDVNFRAEDGEADESNVGGSSRTKKADELKDDKKTSSGEFVRWSKSTEIGDFIRDAARGKEFAVEIEGAPKEIRVAVPSFEDRTYYLRIRLRKKAKQISTMTDIKNECDLAAHHYSQRLAYIGFLTLGSWGAIVAWISFATDLGWDTMEPVTYLVGLAGLLGGYGWFLLHNREASYRTAMKITVSSKQQKLYDERGFDIGKYEYLIDEGNSLRKEIMAIANEYDVDWDERSDAQDEKVVEALAHSRKKKQKESKKDADEEDDDDD